MYFGIACHQRYFGRFIRVYGVYPFTILLNYCVLVETVYILFQKRIITMHIRLIAAEVPKPISAYVAS